MYVDKTSYYRDIVKINGITPQNELQCEMVTILSLQLLGL